MFFDGHEFAVVNWGCDTGPYRLSDRRFDSDEALNSCRCLHETRRDCVDAREVSANSGFDTVEVLFELVLFFVAQRDGVVR